MCTKVRGIEFEYTFDCEVLGQLCTAEFIRTITKIANKVATFLSKSVSGINYVVYLP